MTIRILTILIFILKSFFLSAQGELLLHNAQKTDKDRYEKYNNSPYLWKKNKTITIYPVNGKPIKNLIGNYNLLEREFEIYMDDHFAILPENQYPKITLKLKNQEIVLSAYQFPKEKLHYHIEHFREGDLIIYESKKKLASTVTINTPGKIQTIDKFKNSTDYYAVFNNEVIPFQLKKNKIIKQFGHKKEISNFIKSKKLKVKKIEDAVQIINFIAQQGWMPK